MSLVSKLLIHISLMSVISAVAFGQNPKNEAKKLFDAGGIHLSKGQLEEAIKCYSESIKLDPSSYGGYDMRAYAFDRAGKPYQAIADRTIVLEFFLLEKPPNPLAITRILVNRGLSYIDLGKHTEGRNDYTKAINLSPDNPNPYVYRGLSFYSTNKFEEAIADLTKAIELRDKTYNGLTELYYRGKSYLALDRKDEGLADLSKAKLIKPKEYDALELEASNRPLSKNNVAAQKVEIINLDKDVKLEMVLVPAGKFKMGSPANEKGRGFDETQHDVTLTKPFYMGKYEVTQEQWKSVTGKNPSITEGTKLPVENVSWEDCQEFIKKLNAKTNGCYRLPTEAEWEYACRAGTSTAYSFGLKITTKDVNYDDSNTGIGKPVSVGSYKPNAFGLYDMHGNVSEWCEDGYDNYPAGAVTDPKGYVADPKAPVTEKIIVIRGGTFCLPDWHTRSAKRNFISQKDREPLVGFRLAKTADIKADASLTVPKPDPAEVKPVVGNLLVAPFTEAKAK